MNTDDEWREPFLLRTHGGPAPGTRVIRDGDNGYTWPLPDVLSSPNGDGRYRKVGESPLAPQSPDSHVVRGAEYEWQATP